MLLKYLLHMLVKRVLECLSVYRPFSKCNASWPSGHGRAGCLLCLADAAVGVHGELIGRREPANAFCFQDQKSTMKLDLAI